MQLPMLASACVCARRFIISSQMKRTSLSKGFTLAGESPRRSRASGHTRVEMESPSHQKPSPSDARHHVGGIIWRVACCGRTRSQRRCLSNSTPMNAASRLSGRFTCGVVAKWTTGQLDIIALPRRPPIRKAHRTRPYGARTCGNIYSVDQIPAVCRHCHRLLVHSKAAAIKNLHQ